MTKEQPLDITSIAVMNTNIAYIQKDIATINANIKELAGVYATKTAVDDGIKTVNDRLDRLEKSSNLWRWLSPTLSAVFSAVLTFLVIQYITQLNP